MNQENIILRVRQILEEKGLDQKQFRVELITDECVRVVDTHNSLTVEERRQLSLKIEDEVDIANALVIHQI